MDFRSTLLASVEDFGIESHITRLLIMIMLKKVLILLSLLSSVSVVSAQTTLSGTALSNADDSDANLIKIDGLVGVFVVDTNNDGFSGSIQGSVSAGQALTIGTGFGAVDDIIVGANTYQEVFQDVSYTMGSGFTFDYASVSANDEFGVYLITDPSITSTSDTMTAGSSYGFGRVGTGDYEWLVPTNQNGGTINFTGNPSGSQIQVLTGGTFGNLTAIPEPSAYATILGLLGLGYAVFCRRRRSSSQELVSSSGFVNYTRGLGRDLRKERL